MIVAKMRRFTVCEYLHTLYNADVCAVNVSLEVHDMKVRVLKSLQLIKEQRDTMRYTSAQTTRMSPCVLLHPGCRSRTRSLTSELYIDIYTMSESCLHEMPCRCRSPTT